MPPFLMAGGAVLKSSSKKQVLRIKNKPQTSTAVNDNGCCWVLDYVFSSKLDADVRAWFLSQCVCLRIAHPTYLPV